MSIKNYNEKILYIMSHVDKVPSKWLMIEIVKSRCDEKSEKYYLCSALHCIFHVIKFLLMMASTSSQFRLDSSRRNEEREKFPKSVGMEVIKSSTFEWFFREKFDKKFNALATSNKIFFFLLLALLSKSQMRFSRNSSNCFVSNYFFLFFIFTSSAVSSCNELKETTSWWWL